MTTIFTSEAISKGARSGTIRSPDGLLDVTLGNSKAARGATAVELLVDAL